MSEEEAAATPTEAPAEEEAVKEVSIDYFFSIHFKLQSIGNHGMSKCEIFRSLPSVQE